MDDSLGTRYNEGLGHALDISLEGPICSSFPLPEIRDKMAAARAHQGHNGCEFV